jgi:hypothetical protein
MGKSRGGAVVSATFFSSLKKPEKGWISLKMPEFDR